MPLFQSFFQGGFECSSHRLRTGRRLDLIGSTQHDRFAAEDYMRLQSQRMATARDGIRWHLIEPRPYEYNFSSILPMLRAAERTRQQVIWDLFHYGWPDDLDIFKPEFVRRFAAMARAFVQVLVNETSGTPFVAPVNEISFVSWGGGDVEYLNPFYRGRGFELKAQLVRAAIEATEAVWDVAPQARIVQIDPLIHIAADEGRPHDIEVADRCRRDMFQSWDMIAGRSWPGLGGNEKYLDVIGMNYYWNNQWVHCGRTLRREDALYRPVREIFIEVYQRYQRPLFVAETGIEDERRPEWLAYMCGEVFAAMEAGVPMEGICLYPVVNHPGWDNDRHCHNGLWDYCDGHGYRAIYQPMAAELRRQQEILHRRFPAWDMSAEEVQHTASGT